MRLSSIGTLRSLRRMLRNDANGSRPRLVICAGTACQASGSSGIIRVAKKFILQENLLDKLGLRITGCHGFCEMGPFILTEPQRAFYTQIRLDDVPKIACALLSGTYVDELLYHDPRTGTRYRCLDDIPFFKNQQRTILGPNQAIDPIRIYDYITQRGYEGLETVLAKGEPEWVLEEVVRSGLRGRGGAGFPTGQKWRLLAREPSAGGKFLVCNADEGDPGAYMDRSILEGNPHSIVEGMTIGAFATGATEGIVYVRSEYPLAIKHLTIALNQARELGLLGKNILGTGYGFDISIVRGAGAFVCGEETALIRSIEGKTGEPQQRPPYPTQKGISGRPTAINNVETWANIPVIVRDGSERFSQVGTKGNSGTKVFSLVGKVRNTGLVEVPMGITIGEIVHDIGGGPSGDARVKAVQTGGPSGGCIPVDKFNLTVDYDSLGQAGSIMGSGGMIVMDDNTCMVDVAKYYMNFLKEESCGKCFSCRKGTQRMHEILDDVTKGKATLEQLELLEELAVVVKDASMCGLGQGAPNPVLSTLRYFRSEYEAHIRDRHCPAAVCTDLFKSPCQHACPVGMDIPAYIALVRAGRLDDAYRVLARTNPFPGICGRVCGHECQVKCRRALTDGAVAIMHLKRFITDRAQKPAVTPLPFTRRQRVAVIGAGPSGLTAALELRKRGYPVTVFEALPEAGGMLRYGIPAYRLPRHVLEQEIQDILATGIELHLGVHVGRDVTFEALERDYDAIYLAVGAHRSRPLEIPGEDSRGFHGAVEWLREYNTNGKATIGPRVAVIGGGNSAVDAARTAVRLGADSVTIYYRRTRDQMPAQPHEILAAEQEGVRIVELVAPVRVVDWKGVIKGLELVKMELSDFDRSGRKRPVAILGSEFTVVADIVLSAVSQNPELDFLGPAAVASVHGTVNVDRDQRTSHPKVWAGGDAATGPAMVIDAIRAGQQAARAIDDSIRKAAGEDLWVAPAEPEIKVPFEPGDEDGERPQAAMPMADPGARRCDFREVELGYSVESAVAEAKRCLRCDVTVDVADRPVTRALEVVPNP